MRLDNEFTQNKHSIEIKKIKSDIVGLQSSVKEKHKMLVNVKEKLTII